MATDDYVTCRLCGGFGRRDMHTCPPIWEWRETLNYGEDEWQEVYARTAEIAAEKAAERYDQDDYHLIRNSGASIVIIIRNPATGEVSHWSCCGESLPHYYAKELA
jgi:hypothetical protein